MNLRELKTLVDSGESQRLEFKRKATHPDKIMKEIVAFANAEGGTLLIGVDDNKSIPGLPAADEDEYILEYTIARYCYPDINYRLEKIALSSKLTVLAYHIQPGINKPYMVLEKPDSSNGKIYVRVADKSVQASREVKQILKQRKKDKSFRFQFGDKEKLLMQYLDTHHYITLEAFAALANIPSKQASQTLVLLVLSGVLNIYPDEGEDKYSLVEQNITSLNVL